MGRRIAIVGVLVLAFVAMTAVLLGGREDYRVKARFQAATQVVPGNRVQVGGREVGQVRSVDLTADGQAELELEITDDEYAPLRRGTEASLRAASLSGVVNRYVDLRLPGGEATTPMRDGEVIPATRTTSAVDLDQLFDLFDDRTKRGLQRVLRGSGEQYGGRGAEANAGWRYLNPSFVASTRLFRELNRDPGELEGFLAENAELVTDVADRRDDLAGLVDNLATTTTALGDESEALGESIERLPDFMRRANTTFLNLRATLDDLDPLVEDSKPVAKKLRPLLAELRPLARDSRPTLRSLSKLIRRSGADNDLVELMRAQGPVRDIAVGPVTVNGKERQGALPASTKALAGSVEPLSFFRPYTVDFMGWLDDFSHTGVYDALGGVSRAGLHSNPFMLVGGQLHPVPPELRDEALGATLERNQRNRCPGGAEHVNEDGSNPWKPTPDFNCDPTQVLPGK